MGEHLTVVGARALQGASFRMPWACCRGVLHGGEALFVADSGNHCIRAVSTEGAMGVVRTVFGTPESPGKAPTELNFPWSLCYHGTLLYVGDKYNMRIVVLSPDEPAAVFYIDVYRCI